MVCWINGVNQESKMKELNPTDETNKANALKLEPFIQHNLLCFTEGR